MLSGSDANQAKGCSSKLPSRLAEWAPVAVLEGRCEGNVAFVEAGVSGDSQHGNPSAGVDRPGRGHYLYEHIKAI